MPRVTPFGAVVSGVGSSVAVNGKVIWPRGTVASFLDPSRVLYHARVNDSPETWKLACYNLGTQQHEPVPYGERGANSLAAGGGRWMAFLAGHGVYDATGTFWPYAGLAGVGTDGRGACGSDGTIGLVIDYQGGRGLQLLRPGAITINLPDAGIQTLNIYDKDLAVWVEGGQVKAWGKPDPAPQPEPVSSVRVVKAGSACYLLVTTDTRLLLRQWDQPLGKVVVPTPTAFNADAAAVSSGAIRIVWSLTPGEGPDDIGVADLDVADLGHPLTVPAPPVPAIGRSLFCGWFTGNPSSGSGWTTDVDPRSLPGNCSIDIPSGEVKSYDGQRIGWYVQGSPSDSNIDDINRAIAAARAAHPGDRILAYWPRQTDALPVGADWIAVEAYRLKGEAIDAYEKRTRQRIASCGPCWIVPQAFTSNADLTSDLNSIVPVIGWIAKDTPTVVGLAMFNGSGRKTGYQEHPEVHAAYATLAAGITVPVTVPQEDSPVVIPKITVRQFGAQLTKGQPWSVDATIGDTAVTLRIGGDGNLTIHAINPAGEDQTGAKRHVEVRG